MHLALLPILLAAGFALPKNSKAIPSKAPTLELPGLSDEQKESWRLIKKPQRLVLPPGTYKISIRGWAPKKLSRRPAKNLGVVLRQGKRKTPISIPKEAATDDIMFRRRKFGVYPTASTEFTLKRRSKIVLLLRPQSRKFGVLFRVEANTFDENPETLSEAVDEDNVDIPEAPPAPPLIAVTPESPASSSEPPLLTPKSAAEPVPTALESPQNEILEPVEILAPASATTHNIWIGERVESGFIFSRDDLGYAVSAVGPGNLRIELYVHAPRAPAPALENPVVGVLVNDALVDTVNRRVSYSDLISSPAYDGIRFSSPVVYEMPLSAGLQTIALALPTNATEGLSLRARFVEDAVPTPIITPPRALTPSSKNGPTIGLSLGGVYHLGLSRLGAQFQLEGDYGFALNAHRFSVALGGALTYTPLSLAAGAQPPARLDLFDIQAFASLRIRLALGKKFSLRPEVLGGAMLGLSRFDSQGSMIVSALSTTGFLGAGLAVGMRIASTFAFLRPKYTFSFAMDADRISPYQPHWVGIDLGFALGRVFYD